MSFMYFIVKCNLCAHIPYTAPFSNCATEHYDESRWPQLKVMFCFLFIVIMFSLTLRMTVTVTSKSDGQC